MIHNTVTEGKTLPALSKPAGAANIQSGYQAISRDGGIITGTASIREFVSCQVNNDSHTNVSLYCYSSYGYGANRLPTGTHAAVPVLKDSIVLVDAPTYAIFSGSINKNNVSFEEGTYVLATISGNCSISVPY